MSLAVVQWPHTGSSLGRGGIPERTLIFQIEAFRNNFLEEATL